MPPRRAVELRVGGQTYRVVATDDDPHVQHLADLVDRKFSEVVPNGVGRSMTAHQAMFLTAMALAAEVEEQRRRADHLEEERDRSLRLASRAREIVGRLIQRVETALAPARAPEPATAPRAQSSDAPSRAARPESPATPDLSPPDLDSPDEPSIPSDGSSLMETRPVLGETLSEPFLMDLLDLPQEPTLQPVDLRPANRTAPSPQRPAGPQRQGFGLQLGPATSAPLPKDTDATVPRTSKAGLRLVRRATPSDDDSR